MHMSSRVHLAALGCIALACFGSASEAEEDVWHALNLTSAALAETQAALATVEQSMDAFWVLMGTVLVFFMQAGFALVEAGTMRPKNAHNILTKNILDAAIAGIAFWLVGYGFAYGEDSGGFIGTSLFGLGADFIEAESNSFHNWMFQWAFAATAATIVSGAVAERCQFRAYMAYSAIITSFVFPIVVHWVWGGGLLAEKGFIDFAGSGVVHMVGGLAGAVGAFILGPRTGRMRGGYFSVEIVEDEFLGSSTQASALGTLILWFGWYGFNAGSSLAIYGTGYKVASRAAINTTLAPAAGALATTSILYFTSKGNNIALGAILNSLLGSLVAITAPCSVVEPWAAVVIGAIASPVYLASSALIKQLRIDDPVDASPVHFFNGVWGLLAVAIFQHRPSVEQAGFEWQGFGGQLGAQLQGIAAISAWTLGTSAILFGGLMKLGMFRASQEEEDRGMDSAHHGVKSGHLNMRSGVWLEATPVPAQELAAARPAHAVPSSDTVDGEQADRHESPSDAALGDDIEDGKEAPSPAPSPDLSLRNAEGHSESAGAGRLLTSV